MSEIQVKVLAAKRMIDEISKSGDVYEKFDALVEIKDAALSAAREAKKERLAVPLELEEVKHYTMLDPITGKVLGKRKNHLLEKSQEARDEERKAIFERARAQILAQLKAEELAKQESALTDAPKKSGMLSKLFS